MGENGEKREGGILGLIERANREQSTIFSFEYFPPKTECGVQNLYARLNRMASLGPAWMDVTWSPSGLTGDLTIQICADIQKKLGIEALLHMTCTNMAKEKIDRFLDKIRDSGIRNILCLRGDPPAGEQKWEQVEGGFATASDLVKHIRKRFGSYFTLGVAGYPEGHIECTSYEDDLQHLKHKVDSGADFIITQLFYDLSLFEKYVADCRRIGVNVPIVPGIMPIQCLKGFRRMTEFCRTYIPPSLSASIRQLEGESGNPNETSGNGLTESICVEDGEAVKRFGIAFGVEMVLKLKEMGVRCFHFYTLNLENASFHILDKSGLLAENATLTEKIPQFSP